jgi:hypothetical protein
LLLRRSQSDDPGEEARNGFAAFRVVEIGALTERRAEFGTNIPVSRVGVVDRRWYTGADGTVGVDCSYWLEDGERDGT